MQCAWRGSRFNNGFDKVEKPQEYQDRLRSLARVIAGYLSSVEYGGVAALQECPVPTTEGGAVAIRGGHGLVERPRAEVLRGGRDSHDGQHDCVGRFSLASCGVSGASSPWSSHAVPVVGTRESWVGANRAAGPGERAPRMGGRVPAQRALQYFEDRTLNLAAEDVCVCVDAGGNGRLQSGC